MKLSFRFALHTDRRRGFTLVELLVVIAIIGVLIGLLLPAVQTAREAARRSSCSSNFAQVGKGLLNYESARMSFPMGSKGNNVGLPNWRVHVMPFMEMTEIYEQITMTNVFASTVLLGKFPQWWCPSSDLKMNPTDWSTWFTNPGHFVPAFIGIAGAAPDPAGITTMNFNSNYGGIWCGNGMLVPNEVMRPADCTDGTSNVIIAGEQSAPVPLVSGADLRNRYYTPWGGVTWSTPVSTTNGSTTDSWGMGITGVRYKINPISAAAGASVPYGANTALTSRHAGGMNALRADGSTSFVSESIDFLNFQKQCVRDDGQVTTEQ